MSVRMLSQKLAQEAFKRIMERKKELKTDFEKYEAFAKKFPALIHSCGLAQAVAFALAKKENRYIDDLAAVLGQGGHPEAATGESLLKQTQEKPLSGYLRLNRDAINAASWLKRYVEAVGEDN